MVMIIQIIMVHFNIQPPEIVHGYTQIDGITGPFYT